jgi:cell division control protein 45
MYLPRSLISTLYIHLQRSHHPLSPPVLILVALEPDALCACRILTHLLKRDYIPHKIQPIAGYGDLEKAGQNVIKPTMESQGGSGGVVVCLGVGGLVDLGALLGIDAGEEEGSYGGVEVWIIDARRPWNLGNVFGGQPQMPVIVENGEPMYQKQPGVEGGKLGRDYKPGKGGVIVFDDGDIEEELHAERDAYLALLDMPEVEDNGDESDGSETESEDGGDDAPIARLGQKRKSCSDRDEEDESSDDDDRPRQRRRSNSVSSYVDICGHPLTFYSPAQFQIPQRVPNSVVSSPSMHPPQLSPRVCPGPSPLLLANHPKPPQHEHYDVVY